MRCPLFLVVSGPPASGTSTLAPALAEEIQMPLADQSTFLLALGSKPSRILTDPNTTAPTAHSEKAPDGPPIPGCRFDPTVAGN